MSVSKGIKKRTSDLGIRSRSPTRDCFDLGRVFFPGPSIGPIALRSKSISGELSRSPENKEIRGREFISLSNCENADPARKPGKTIGKGFSLGKCGAFTLPLVLFLGVLSLAVVELWKLRKNWEQTVKVQIKLDRCTGKASLWARGSIEATENSNLRMIAIRASLSATNLLPPVRAALQAALEAEGLLQEARSTAWKLKKFRWLLQPCEEILALAEQPFPEEPWTHLPRDALGPQPRKWQMKARETFEFKVRNTNQKSRSMLEKNDRAWKVAWTPPDGASTP